MKRYIPVFFKILLLSFFIFPGHDAFGQAEVDILVNNVDVQFPTGVVFSFEGASAIQIERVDLFYGTSGRSCQPGAARQSFDFDPDTRIGLEWQWDWKRSGILPPGSQIWWEWEITDASGEVLRLPRETVTIEDQRNEWQVIAQNDIVLRWYWGDETFGRDMHTIAVESLDRLSQEIGIRPDDVIHITIYPTGEDLREALLISADWTGGRAFPDHDSFIMAIFPDEMAWARSVIPHELTHLVVDTFFYNCRGAFLPTWLSEGLAEYGEASEVGSELDMVIELLEDNSLPPLRSLASGFSAYGDSARLSYLQSNLVVTYLYDEFGQEKVLRLLETLREGESIDRSLQEVYGFDTNGLDNAWRETLGFSLPLDEQNNSPGVELTKTPIPTLPLLSLGIEPTPTTSITPLPPSPIPTPAQTKVETPLPAPSPEEILAPEPDIQETGEERSLSWPAVLVVGAGALLLLSLIIYQQFFRR